MKNAFNFEMIDTEIGILTFDYPDSKANKFNTATMTELSEKIDEIVNKSEIKCLLFLSAKKGIFIATSNFPKSAIDYVNQIEHKIILIDGQKLAEMMIDNNIGLSIEAVYELKKIDSDYFEES